MVEQLNNKIIDKNISDQNIELNNAIAKFKDYNIEKYLEVYGNKSNLDDIKIILNYNCDSKVNFVNKNKFNAVLYSCLLGCKLEIIKYFIDLKVDYNQRSIYNKTCLHHAVKFCSLEVIKYLSELGLSIVEPDDNKETPLHLACAYNSKEIIFCCYEIYIKQSSEINLNSLLTNFKESILHKAAVNNIEVIDFVSNYVDVNLQDNYGNTVLHLACRLNSDFNVITLLIKKGVMIINS